MNQNFSEHIINKHERIVLHLCLHSVSSSTYRPVCILSFLSTAETDVLVQALSQSTDGVVVSFVVVLKFPNVTIRTTKTVESVQLNGVVVSVVVVFKFPNITIRTTKTVESFQLSGVVVNVVVVLKFPNVTIRTTKTVESVQLSGVVVSVVVVLKFPNITIKTTKKVESVQLNGVVVSFVVVLKFPNITIRTTKTVESIQLKGRIKIVGSLPPFHPPLHLCYYLPKHIVLLFDSWKPFGHLQLLLS